MKQIRMVGLCVIAVFAIGAVAAGAASAALPEFTGPFPKKFTNTSGRTTLQNVNGTRVSCGADNGEGRVTGAQTATLTINYTACNLFGFPCHSAGAAEGEVQTTALIGTLGYINGPAKEVGLDIEAPGAGPLAVFECSKNAFVIKGSVIGKITPVNKVVKIPHNFRLSFNRTGSTQAITHFEGGATKVLEASLNGGTFLVTGLRSAERVFFEEEPVGINA